MEGSERDAQTQGVRLELLAKLDSVHIAPSDNPVEKYLKMEEYAQVLCSSSGDMQHINEPFLLGKIIERPSHRVRCPKAHARGQGGWVLAGGRDDHRQKAL